MEMKTLVIIATVVVFGYFVAKKKVFPSLRKRGLIKPTHAAATDIAVPDAPTGSTGVAAASSARPKSTFFEVLAFSTLESENSVMFRERVGLHVTRAAAEINSKGVDFDINYISLGEVLVIIMSYRL